MTFCNLFYTTLEYVDIPPTGKMARIKPAITPQVPKIHKETKDGPERVSLLFTAQQTAGISHGRLVLLPDPTGQHYRPRCRQRIGRQLSNSGFKGSANFVVTLKRASLPPLESEHLLLSHTVDAVT